MYFLAAAGFDFKRHADEGLSMQAFGERLTASGLLLNDKVCWIAFHGMYDFAYLLKLLTGSTMPVSLSSFDDSLNTFFPERVDIKWHLPKGSLSRLGAAHGLQRNGVAHQSGSDAFLTLELFCQMGECRLEAHGCLFGLHESSGDRNSMSRASSGRLQQILAAQRAAKCQRQWVPQLAQGQEGLLDMHLWPDELCSKWFATWDCSTVDVGSQGKHFQTALNPAAPAFSPSLTSLDFLEQQSRW